MVMLLRDFRPCGIILIALCACVAINVTVEILLRGFGLYGIIFMTVCLLITLESKAVPLHAMEALGGEKV
jgi:hypothetical protein